MNIHGVTVSVNYADFLQCGIERWKRHLASWTIITDSADEATTDLALRHGLSVFRTDLFYERGAAFNKGAAMELACRQVVPWKEWVAFIDADVVPEVYWHDAIRAADPQCGRIYGCWRYDAPTVREIDDMNVPFVNDDRIGYGYFQLFHSQDPVVQKRKPLLDTDWTHAGNYDSTFLMAWPGAHELRMRLWHIGGVSHNWYGRGRQAEFRAMERERRRRGGGWLSIEGERLV